MTGPRPRVPGPAGLPKVRPWAREHRSVRPGHPRGELLQVEAVLSEQRVGRQVRACGELRVGPPALSVSARSRLSPPGARIASSKTNRVVTCRALSASR
jgi:hypothetical protein